MTIAGVLLTAVVLSASSGPPIDLAAERARVLAAASQYVREAPITVTATHSPRSAGGLHDFFSEGDYWWPDPEHPDGPYVQRDGMTNPANFVEHRRALRLLALQSGSDGGNLSDRVDAEREPVDVRALRRPRHAARDGLHGAVHQGEVIRNFFIRQPLLWFD